MRATLSIKQLQDIVDLMRGFVSRHATLPVLENIYIKGGIDTILFRATDMEKYIEIEIPAQIDDEWALTVNAKTFGDIIKNIDDEQVTLVIEESNTQMTIHSSSDEFQIKGISASEYVALPEVQSDTEIQLDTEAFVKGIEKVEYAVTEKNFSPVLTGIYMRVAEHEWQKYLVFVGTDSFRLAEYKIPFDGKATDMSLIIPKVHINDIKRVASYAAAQWTKQMKSKYANNMTAYWFELDGMQIMCSTLLIQWSFPDYEQESIMPTSFNTKALIDATQLEKAIKKIEILTRDLNNYISVNGWWDKIKLSSGETDMGHAGTSTSALIEWDDFTYGVNGKYITDFLRSASSDEIIMRVIDGEKPIIFKDKEDEQFTYVVRPLVK